jgi:hypothetical protein
MFSERTISFQRSTSDCRPHSDRVLLDQKFECMDLTFDRNNARLGQAWQQLLASGDSPEKIYQTPAYVEHVHETSPDIQNWRLIVIERTDRSIVGILPVRKGVEYICFKLGPVCLLKHSVEVLQILGSVPLLCSSEKGLHGFAIKTLLQRYPECRALVMQSVPVEMMDQYQGFKGVSYRVLYGWRDCHVCRLPDTIDQYMRRFSAKKRYNLSRQIRLLEERVGKTQLIRITDSAQVPDVIEAMESIPAAQSYAARREQFDSLAKNGLMLCYLLRSRKSIIGLIVGNKTDEVWHVSKIFYDEKYAMYSAGTSILHLAQQDIIENLPIRRIDFGYGTPHHDYRSSHSLEKRGKIFVCHSYSYESLALKVHEIFEIVNRSLSICVKRMREKYRHRRPR